MSAADVLALFAHFAMLSLLAVSGAIALAPEMHRTLVEHKGWLDDGQFTASIALAQAAPGPNVLFVPLIGWHVGLNAGGWAWGLVAMAVSLLGIMLPSSVLTLCVTRWAHRHREHRGIRAFKQGMAPLVVALLLSTGWVLAAVHDDWRRDAGLWTVTLGVALLFWRTRVHLLWLFAAGAALGAAGWI